MNFVIGVIGLVIIVAMASYRQAADEIYKKKFQEEYLRDTIGLSEWIKIATDVDNESELMAKISRHEICEIIRTLPHYNSIEEFYGRTELNDDAIFWYFNKQLRGTWERIALGSQGKLFREDALNGIKSPGVWDKKEINKWLIHYDIMVWLNDQLHKHGITEKMRFINGAQADSAGFDSGRIVGNPIEDNEINVIGGLYYWHPARRSYLYVAPKPNMTVGKNKK